MKKELSYPDRITAGREFDRKPTENIEVMFQEDENEAFDDASENVDDQQNDEHYHLSEKAMEEARGTERS